MHSSEAEQGSGAILLNMVWFKPVPLTAVGAGRMPVAVLEVEFPVPEAVPVGTAESVTRGAEVVVGLSPLPSAVRVGAGVDAGGGSCLRTTSNRPAAATLKQSKRQRRAHSWRLRTIIVGFWAPGGARRL